jgi:O-Antigen ligase
LRSSPTSYAGSVTFETLRTGLLWLMFASSFVVKIEPAPVDVLFFAVFSLYFFSGLKLTPSASLIGILLVLYNFSGFVSYLPVADKPKTGLFIITSIYMSMTAFFLCCFVTTDTDRRFHTIAQGVIAGGAIAAVCGYIGFFNLGGLGPLMTLSGRATGLFKDPNVYSTYLNFPIILLLQRLLLNAPGSKMLTGSILLLIVGALFLAFSRGAWVSTALSIALLFGLTFLLSGSAAMQLRVVTVVIMGALTAMVLFAILLSIPEINALFVERAQLIQPYDGGETGRFGAQANSIPLLLKRPLGFGPLQYSSYMGLDPHNTFLNAFASYGWLGGIVYISIVGLTVTAGLRTVMMRGPWQGPAIAVFSSMLALILQGVQIDTDHWRHFYWLLGCTWGLFAATTQQYRQQQLRTAAR